MDKSVEYFLLGCAAVYILIKHHGDTATVTPPAAAVDPSKPAGGAPGDPTPRADTGADLGPITAGAPTGNTGILGPSDNLGGYKPAGGYGKQWGNKGNGDYDPNNTVDRTGPIYKAPGSTISYATNQGGFNIASGYR